MQHAPGVESDLPPIGTEVTFNGEPYVVTGHNEGRLELASVQSIESDPADEGQPFVFEKGTPAEEKARELRAATTRLAAHGRRMPAGPQRDWTLRQARAANRRCVEIERDIALAPQRSPQRTGTRARGAGRPRAQATRSQAQSGDSGDPEPPTVRRCTAPWCDHPLYGPPQQRYCGTERCNQSRAAERQRRSRLNNFDVVEHERREALEHARLAGYVGGDAFAAAGRHSLSFLWRFGFADGEDPGELEALGVLDGVSRRLCRCNGHHIDGGVIGCFRCGMGREAAAA